MEEQITISVIQAKDLTPFTDINKKRIIGYHYFRKTGDTWFFCWVEETTDGKTLLEQINAGEIYIFKD